MPELPEVEVLRRHLAAVLPGKRVASVDVPKPRSIRPARAAAFQCALDGARFVSVDRRAKYLVFDLERRGGPVRMLGHLGMTGRIYLAPASAPVPRHAAVVFGLGRGGGRLVFEDPRGFGRLVLGDAPLAGIGPEPLGLAFNAAGLGEALRGSRRPVKVALMDQSVVAGVGNIYASEALFRARIRPDRAAGSLSPDELARLVAAVRDVLGEAVHLGASASLDFAGGSDGLFYFGSGDAGAATAERFAVYDRAGEPCRECGRPVRRVVQAGRGTFFCDRCQR